jgi:ATP-dependent RNA helicase RhlE
MTFEDFNLPKSLFSALNDANFTTPTTIQARAYPFVMSGRDVLGIAQTGTGKTLAYLLPTLKQWKFSSEKAPTVLILVPTRELVVQVVTAIQTLTKYMTVRVGGVYGGVGMPTHIALVEGGLDILVGTPGRLLDLSLKKVLRLNNIKKLIIDEVDEMLDLGFRPQLARIFDLLPVKRQNIMFSATMTEPIELIIHDYFNSPEKVEAAPTGTPLENIVQTAYHVPNFNSKVNLLKILLKDEEVMSKVLIFASSKRLADQVWEAIGGGGFFSKIGIVHSGKTQSARFGAVKQFHAGEFPVLVATDLIARGIDISEVSHVINFDLSDEPEAYMHRIGRTGRADKKGIAISLINTKEEEYQKAIEGLMNQPIEVLPHPADLVLSDVLTEDELPKKIIAATPYKILKKDESNAAFHEKSDKNKKVNNKIRRTEKMMLKYGKKQTRGQKSKKK